MKIFSGKFCVVTGAGSGIGKALSLRLLELGAIVYALDINAERLAELETGDTSSRLHKTQIDITREEQVSTLLAAITESAGNIDYLFNVAGITIAGEARNLSREDWQRVLDVNLNGVINTTVESYRHMADRGHGHIVNIASVQGLVPLPLEAPYVTSKYAVVGLSQALRVEGRDLGVKVSVVCPGMVATPIFDSPMINIPRDRYEAYVKPWKRFAVSPQDCAESILRGVAKNRAIIPVTFMARLMWWLGRISPGALNAILIADLGKLRASLK
ncbi:MAG: SDR family NAD(P)-dependent oxidoreductase [Haliea sp.]|nr:SDR family NAD(P)-dependent oxidoreductase [Haliea sp.]